MDRPHPLLTAHTITKRYGAVTALADASLDLLPGEIHALVGENGAGKSTLVRVLAGIEEPDGGSVRIAGNRRGPQHHTAVAVVPQYPRMAPSMPVWQNLLVGDEPRRGPFIARRDGLRRIDSVARRFNIDLDVECPAAALGGTEIRLAALLSALVRNPSILILDEPTVGLSGTDREAILTSLTSFRDAQHAILFISHDLEEIAAICDRVTILAAGRTVQTIPAPVSADHLATILFGRRAAAASVAQQDTDERPEERRSTPSLELHGAVIRGRRTTRPLGPIDIAAYPGCIGAVTGMRESGLDLFERYFSGEARLESGVVRLAGKTLGTVVEPADLRRLGLAYIPSDRFDRAAALSGSVEENAILHERTAVHPLGFRAPKNTHGVTSRLLDVFGIRAAPTAPLGALSGGTIQKLILARELDKAPAVCIIVDPTAGLDLEGQLALRDTLREMAAGGTAVLVLSTSIESVLILAERITVLHDRAVVGRFAPHQKEAIARAFAGVKAKDAEIDGEERS